MLYIQLEPLQNNLLSHDLPYWLPFRLSSFSLKTTNFWYITVTIVLAILFIFPGTFISAIDISLFDNQKIACAKK